MNHTIVIVMCVIKYNSVTKCTLNNLYTYICTYVLCGKYGSMSDVRTCIVTDQLKLLHGRKFSKNKICLGDFIPTTKLKF